MAMTAREAVQMAEDSRAIAVKRQEEEALPRSGSAPRSAKRARTRTAAAQSETDRVTREAEAARIAPRRKPNAGARTMRRHARWRKRSE